MRHIHLLAALIIIHVVPALPALALDKRDVLVVYNTCTYYAPASEGVARYYAAARDIPAENLLGTYISIDTTKVERIRDTDYVTYLATPIYGFLESHPNIRVIVLCYGVPYIIDHYPSSEWWRTGVDSALMLVGGSTTPSTRHWSLGYGPPPLTPGAYNPYYNEDTHFCTFRDSSSNDTTWSGTHFSVRQLVCRLDGYASPTTTVTVDGNQYTIPASVKGIIDKAKHADEIGHSGLTTAMAILDDAPGGRGFPTGLETALNDALRPITGRPIEETNVHREPGTTAQSNTFFVDTSQSPVLDVFEYSSSGWYDQSAVETTVWFRPRNTWLDGSIGLYWMVSEDAHWLREPAIASPRSEHTHRIYSYLEPDNLKVLAYHIGGEPYPSIQYDEFPFPDCVILCSLRCFTSVHSWVRLQVANWRNSCNNG